MFYEINELGGTFHAYRAFTILYLILIEFGFESFL